MACACLSTAPAPSCISGYGAGCTRSEEHAQRALDHCQGSLQGAAEWAMTYKGMRDNGMEVTQADMQAAEAVLASTGVGLDNLEEHLHRSIDIGMLDPALRDAINVLMVYKSRQWKAPPFMVRRL